MCGRNGLVRSSASYPHTCPLSTPRRPTKRSPTPHERTQTHSRKARRHSRRRRWRQARRALADSSKIAVPARACNSFPPFAPSPPSHPLPRCQSDLQYKISAYQEFTLHSSLYVFVRRFYVGGPFPCDCILNFILEKQSPCLRHTMKPKRYQCIIVILLYCFDEKYCSLMCKTSAVSGKN